MTIMITGATGMIGSLVLQHCLDNEEVSKVISITRRAGDIKNPKLEEFIPESFEDYSKDKDLFKDVAVAYFCLGVYTGAVEDALFKKITVDYHNAFAMTLSEQSPQITFCLLSGAGADQEEKSRVSFARYKGMAENYLLSLPLEAVQIFRPGYIYPVEPRDEPNIMYKVSRMLYPIFKLLGKKYSIKSTELASAMYLAGIQSKGNSTMENHEILEFLSTIS